MGLSKRWKGKAFCEDTEQSANRGNQGGMFGESRTEVRLK